MATARAPKQWCLTKSETVNTFENWKQNIQYILSLDQNFAPYLIDNVTWAKKTKTEPLRGFTNDGDDIAENNRRTGQQKVTQLELMLGFIANFCPIISRNTIVKNSTSLASLWQAIRLHFGFQSSGAHFIDFADFKLEPGERPEDLYQRLIAFVEDNLLEKNGNISHHGVDPTDDEELTPSLENMVVLHWLKLVHHDLPRLVKQRYGTELRTRTLASIKSEISQSLDSLLEEIRSTDDARVMRFRPPFQTSQSSRDNRRMPQRSSDHRIQHRNTSRRVCPLCQQAKRNKHDHFLSSCPYLPESDKKFMSRARTLMVVDECDDDQYENLDDETQSPERESIPVNRAVKNIPSTRRVQTGQSPYINTFCGHHPIKVTIDSGAETNTIKESVARFIGAPITKSSQGALQADGQSPLVVKGETRFTVTRDNHTFQFEGLVIENMDVDILAGIPWMIVNDITIRPAKHQIILADDSILTYGEAVGKTGPHSIRRTQAHVLRAPLVPTTVWPGDFIELEIPPTVGIDTVVAVEPRMESPCTQSGEWPHPTIVNSVGSKIRLANTTSEPMVLKRQEHICQVSQVFSPSTDNNEHGTDQSTVRVTTKAYSYSDGIMIDPGKTLPAEFSSKFQELHSEFDNVFNPEYTGYNGAVGPFKAIVNMGPVLPPQRKGRLPQYARNKLVELQDKFDSLEKIGVFKRPEDIDISVEYLNPSFLVKKPNGGSRLVTAFADVGRYSKPQPSLLPDVDSTLRTVAQWKYIIVSDLTSAFFQIPLSRDSMKYCGVATPFKGIRVYTRCAMGMPGSETALEELMCRVLGDLLHEGVVAKIADDLYCGGDTPSELLTNWRHVLQALHRCSLSLSAAKTIVAPACTTILGWIWSHGSIQASPHRIATLSSCTAPETVRNMRSFIGAFKFLARVLPNCATLIAPLDNAIAGKQSQDKVVWSDSLRESFTQAQQALATNKPVVIPRPTDQLWIVTDGAVKNPGLGATLYITGRGSKPQLAGFFSAKFQKKQLDWIPCEVEALSIATAVKHFSPYIIQSEHKTCILTDSKPCVQAYEKLCRGEFSNSARVATFLATVSRFQVTVRHLAGNVNLPSDFQSRNAPSCEVPNCQICSFITRIEDSVVRLTSIPDIISGTTKAPYTSRPAWALTQAECPDLRRTHAHLTQGTRPSKKATNIRDVKRYLQVASVARDGLLVVKKIEPLKATSERIIVPRSVLDGLLTALHIKLVHPTCHQLKLIAHRYYYALDMDKAIEHITDSCHQCASLKKIPHTVTKQTTGDPPDIVGSHFVADVMKRDRHLVLVVRETVSSYTVASLVENEQATTLRTALIKLCIELRPLDGPPSIIRVDPAPGFISLIGDSLLQEHRLQIEVGRTKNVNKNPVAEKAVQELEDELLRQDPRGGGPTPLDLSIAVARLNSRIRGHGMSSREMLFQRDQFTCAQLPIHDQEIILQQHAKRLQNHPYSEVAKAPLGKQPTATSVQVGDIVYVTADKTKTCARHRYLVVSVDGDWCNIRKFVGHQLRSGSYRIKKSQCFKVPSQVPTKIPSSEQNDSDNEELCSQPPIVPIIPQELSQPLNDDINAPMLDNEDTCAPVPYEEELSHSNTEQCATHPRRSSRAKHPPQYLVDNYML